MSNSNFPDANPYQASVVYEAAISRTAVPTVGPTKLDLARAATWMFKSPNWMNNILCLFVCGILSSIVIGSLAAIGYQIEIIQRRALGRDRDYPDFEPNRAMDYLIRGVWPFLVYLIAALVLTLAVVVVGALVVAVCVLPFAQGPGDPPATVIALMLFLLACLGLATMAATVFVVGPMTLRAGLANKFEEGFRFDWVKDFFRRMWKTMLLAFVYMFCMAIIAEVLGLALCIVGLYFTLAWFQLFAADLSAQLYDIYLNRGGESIPLPDLPVR